MTEAASDRPLAPFHRWLGASAAAVLGFVASPGITGRGGSSVIAVLGMAVWTATVVRPLGPRRKRALLAEGLGGGLAIALLMWWVTYVVAFGLLFIAAGWGVYALGMGALLRRLNRRLPLPLAAAVAWTSVETLRSWLHPPFGLGWFRLGHYAHDDLLLAGSARVAGVEGLSFVLAALGGGLAAVALERRLRMATLVSSLAPLGAAALAALVIRAPATADGPRVLLVQPGFTQRRKQFDDPEKNFAESRRLTHESAAAAGPVDLVCWGESMLYVPLLDPAGEEAIRRGARPASWQRPLDETWLRNRQHYEDSWVRQELLELGHSTSRFPKGASFAAGAEFLHPEDGGLERRVALVLYDSQGIRQPPAFKRHLVPLGETMFGLERLAFVRDVAEKAAGYVPDLCPGTETGVLTLEARDGRRFRVSGTVCFDNAYVDVYVDALQQGPVDFHLVASNEAWYEESCEMDQMVAFSRVIAVATGRSIVRSTNSGVSTVLGPDGTELGRVVDASGKDRSIAGWGAWTVPVPIGQPGPTPLVRLFEWLQAFWILLGPATALLPGRSPPAARPR